MTNDEQGIANGESAAVDSTLGELYRLLPSLNDLLLSADFKALLRSHSRGAVVRCTRAALDELRYQISIGQHTRLTVAERLSHLANAVSAGLGPERSYSLRPVINATGVILHTNLGRSPLSQSALDHIVEVASAYSNLELDLETGERSRRDVHAETLLLQLLNIRAGTVSTELTHGAVILNNCAAATFLALNTFAEGAEVLISRGELIEIGGGFRIPEILRKSGAQLREIGTTNRTRLADYEEALSPNVALILRVHQSNFSMEGFTERPMLQELVSLGKERGVPVFEDQGTGLLSPLEYGLRGEATLTDSFHRGTDLIAASGDKLLGGPQCGILIGRQDLIERIRRNPLLRTFRVDKLTYAALEATLLDYLSDRTEEIPILRMMGVTSVEIQKRCEWIVSRVNPIGLAAGVVPVMSIIGGGAAPGAQLPSFAVSLQHARLDACALLQSLRRLQPPIIGRISDNRVLLDMRTVDPEFDRDLASLLDQFVASHKP
jgi:L-seryl-tRNA(Ser) seleniumtransferase